MKKLLLILAAILSAGIAYAQQFPTRPVRIITAAAGGISDFTSRLIAQSISGPLGQPVIVDNRTSVTSVDIVQKAPPDGYSMLLGGGNLWIGPLLQELSYDIVRDFSPIVLVIKENDILAIHPSLPAKSVKELIALAKAKPGELNYSSSGVGGSSQLQGEMFKSMAGVTIVWVPYKGGAQAIEAVLSNEVQMTIASALTVLAQAKAGKMRALAVAGAEPSPLAPGLPTISTSGLPGYEYVGMTGIFAPAKTPKVVIDRLNQEIVRFINTPEAKEKFLNAGVVPAGSTPEQFGAIIKAEIVKLGKLIKDAGIKVK